MAHRQNSRGKAASSVNPMGVSPDKERTTSPLSQGEQKAKKERNHK